VFYYLRNLLHEICKLAYLSSKFAIVNMEVCTTNSTGLDFDLPSIRCQSVEHFACGVPRYLVRE
jgi:hypothetical protein